MPLFENFKELFGGAPFYTPPFVPQESQGKPYSEMSKEEIDDLIKKLMIQHGIRPEYQEREAERFRKVLLPTDVYQKYQEGTLMQERPSYRPGTLGEALKRYGELGPVPNRASKAIHPEAWGWPEGAKLPSASSIPPVVYGPTKEEEYASRDIMPLPKTQAQTPVSPTPPATARLFLGEEGSKVVPTVMDGSINKAISHVKENPAPSLEDEPSAKFIKLELLKMYREKMGGLPKNVDAFEKFVRGVSEPSMYRVFTGAIIDMFRKRPHWTQGRPESLEQVERERLMQHEAVQEGREQRDLQTRLGLLSMLSKTAHPTSLGTPQERANMKLEAQKALWDYKYGSPEVRANKQKLEGVYKTLNTQIDDALRELQIRSAIGSPYSPEEVQTVKREVDNLRILQGYIADALGVGQMRREMYQPQTSRQSIQGVQETPQSSPQPQLPGEEDIKEILRLLGELRGM